MEEMYQKGVDQSRVLSLGPDRVSAQSEEGPHHPRLRHVVFAA